MKKSLPIIILLVFIIISGCSKPTDNTLALEKAQIEERLATTTVDYDLTVMSSTMIYGQVHNMVTAPSYFEGSFIKAKGTYEEDSSNEVARLVIHEALSCCAQGLEIRFPEGLTPPNSGTEIIIIGTSNYYESDEEELCYIIVESFEVIENATDN